MVFQGRIAKALWMAALLLGVSATSQAAKPKVEAVPGEYIVKLRGSFSFMSQGQVANALNGQVKTQFQGDKNLYVIKRNPAEKQEFVLNSLSDNPMVEYIEPNYIYRINALPNDPELNRLWGLINTGQRVSRVAGTEGIDVDAKRAWEIQTGSRDVKIAVIDTGVDYTIADLAPNMWTNEAEKNGEPGVDDDGNGYVDDIHGYDFANDDGDPMDDHGHGSHCSGTIGAHGNDGEGIVGVAWNVQIVGIKFLTGSGGGTLEDAISSIDYATKVGVDAMSNSWGGGGRSEALKEAIQRANDAGILFLAAAGNSNSNNDQNPTYPATYDVPNVLSVAAIDNRGQLASFSSYGATTVDVAAPGVNILSTTPGGLKSWSGTSMATPHVSGVAALVLANEPNITMADLKDRLISTAKPLGNLRGRVASAGIVNAYHALTNTPAPADPNDPFTWDKQAYSIETEHPYANDFERSWTINVPGAEKVSVFFERFDTESGYDKVTFKDGQGNVVGVWSGSRDGSFSPVVNGDTVVMTFTSDGSVNRYGFKVEAVAFK